MENLLLLIATTFFMRLTRPAGYNRYTIANTGCSIRFFADPGVFTATRTPDGEMMYYNDCTIDEVSYGSVTVALADVLVHDDTIEEVMLQLMRIIKNTHYIKYVTGTSTGLKQKEDPNVQGMVEYWQDDKGIDWKVKSWTNGAFIIVLYVKNISKACSQQQDIYLDGIKFR